VLDYIGDNLSDDLSLSELASVAGMSAHYFAELFRESTGHSPHRYVLLQRIEHAKQSLGERGNSVIEAALAAGFENPSHFARVFRKYVGTSPSRFQSEMARAYTRPRDWGLLRAGHGDRREAQPSASVRPSPSARRSTARSQWFHR
jgi:AraC-like DNA-binding protein